MLALPQPEDVLKEGMFSGRVITNLFRDLTFDTWRS